MFQKNGEQEAQIKKRAGAAIMGQVWEIGKRRLEETGGKGYGCLGWYGIWSKNLEMERKGGNKENARKIYKMSTRSRIWNTPGYLVREELQRNKLKIKAGKRA